MYLGINKHPQLFAESHEEHRGGYCEDVSLETEEVNDSGAACWRVHYGLRLYDVVRSISIEGPLLASVFVRY